MARAQPQRRVRAAQTHRHHTGPVPGQRALAVQPFVELGGLADRLLVAEPAHLVRATQPQLRLRDRPVRADPARRVLDPHEPRQTRCGGKERGLADAARPLPAPLNLVLPAQIPVHPSAAAGTRRPCRPTGRSDAPAGRRSRPAGTSDRTTVRRSTRSGSPAGPGRPGPVETNTTAAVRAFAIVTGCSPHTVRNAASNAGSCTSTWP